MRAQRWWGCVVALGLSVACAEDFTMPSGTATRTYCATTQGLLHHYAWPWHDSTTWDEVALPESTHVGEGYCLTLRHRSETRGTFTGGGSFGAWFDIQDLEIADTIRLWYWRNDLAQGSFAVDGPLMWLTFDRGGRWLVQRPYLQHTAPDADGFITSGTTATRSEEGYLFLTLRWVRVDPPTVEGRRAPPPLEARYAARPVPR